MSSEGEPTIKVAVTGETEKTIERPPPEPDTILAGRYRLGRRIGKGGMGEVMAARDEQVGRDVAIKRMRAANPSERSIRRFLREATVQGRLEHPAIVPVHEIGHDPDGLPFFVMKKLTGTSLSDLLVEGDRPLQKLLRAFANVCLAVEFAHVRGIVHRDLKADNIMMGDFGEVYVLDWGVAKVAGEEDGEFADVGTGSGGHETGAGTAIGTPGYMAPEQVRGAPDLDGRADVYTLGCLLFEILAGESLHPRGWNGMQSALAGIDARPSERAPEREIPPELDAICVDACAPLVAERIPTARELAARIHRFLDGDRDVALRRQLARDHFERATSAFVEGAGTEQRRTAMREAAGALALDPQLAGAAALVGRLMIEPPRDTPPEVTKAIAADDVRTAIAISRAGLWSLVGAILFLPFIWWIAPSGSGYVLAFAGVLVFNTCWMSMTVITNKPRPGLVVLGNSLVLIILSRMFSPILIAPGIAALLAMAAMLTPRFSWVGTATAVFFFTVAAAIGPLVAEHLGLVSSTMSISEEGVLLRAPGISGHEQSSTIIVGALYIIGIIFGACAIGSAMRSRTREAHRHLHLQAWQLRQLVPPSPAT